MPGDLGFEVMFAAIPVEPDWPTLAGRCCRPRQTISTLTPRGLPYIVSQSGKIVGYETFCRDAVKELQTRRRAEELGKRCRAKSVQLRIGFNSWDDFRHNVPPAGIVSLRVGVREGTSLRTGRIASPGSDGTPLPIFTIRQLHSSPSKSLSR